jgi:hypothetical protein
MPSLPTAPDAAIGQDRSSLVSAAILLVAFLWCVYWLVHGWRYWEDDAYIHLEFARSLAQDRGFAFNGHVVSGDTAPLWVFLLAGMQAIIPDWLVAGPNWLFAGKLLCVLGAIFGLSGAYAFARSLSTSMLPSFARAAYLPAALVLLIVVNPYFCYWSFSGMEPLAASGLACFAVLAATREQPSTKLFLTACLLAGIAPLMRPEMIFLTALLALPLLGQWLRLPASPAKPAAFAAGLFLLAAPLVAWSLYSLHAFGHLVPNTNAAKRAAPADSVVHRLLNIYSLGLPLILFGLIAGILYLAVRPSAGRNSIRIAITQAFAPSRSARPHSLPLPGWIFILWTAIATIFYIANHTYVQTRYILVTAPGLTIVVVIAALAAFPRAGRVLYFAALLWATAISLVLVRPFLRNKAIDCDVSRDLALFMRDRIPPDAPVAVYAIGEIAFVSQHPIVDTGGITRPGAVPYLNAPPEAMLRWARSEGAQYILASDQPEPGAVAVYTVDERFVGWTLHTSLYATSTPLSLWKLPTSIDPPQ